MRHPLCAALVSKAEAVRLGRIPREIVFAVAKGESERRVWYSTGLSRKRGNSARWWCSFGFPLKFSNNETLKWVLTNWFLSNAGLHFSKEIPERTNDAKTSVA